MNTQAFAAGNEAYKQANFGVAVELFVQAKGPGEVSGQIDHLLGNCYMRLGRYDEAAVSYADALRDSTYGHTGALACNRGRALLAAGRPQEAVASLTMATKDGSYATPYKAYIALGDAYLQLGDARDGGVAYRNAAIDESNPKPSVALTKLGSCFMKLGRAADAIEAYRTALDFATAEDNQNKIYASMGLAYVAANRMSEAADAFGRATTDGHYQLTPEERISADAAQRALSAKSGDGPSETDALLAAAGYGSQSVSAGVDPLDPLGKSGEFIPSPEDTGFFSLNEEEVVKQDKKIRRKHKHGGLKAFFIFFFILVLLLGAAAFAYWKGYGWPMQADVTTSLFEKANEGADYSSLVSPKLTDDARKQLDQELPAGVKSVKAVTQEQSMSTSKVLVDVQLQDGGSLAYTATLVREGIGWKVAKIELQSPSTAGGDTKLETEPSQSDTADKTDANATQPTENATTQSNPTTDTQNTSEQNTQNNDQQSTDSNTQTSQN
ncbi:tetratricopeptide repeat protein [Coriobacteriaceae bacterium BV3Ac1]|uniref:tetratricopeptide repeat protein n=1 Tax=Olegusella massiliensis TaxID=1776381 RepID=UPI0003AE5EE2|nr:tetratricopeptide repeat protein [Olegusella massiliensis]ERL12259.1 tetratricopeptide repeat protein [Coriobacteriaceae bacterium BV3Ac1]MBS5865913.1 tetratricopeptide repeat protein [Coriobacteriaceae bacterium]